MLAACSNRASGLPMLGWMGSHQCWCERPESNIKVALSPVPAGLAVKEEVNRITM